MASDEDYLAFLDKVNKDPSEGYAEPTSTPAATIAQGTKFRATEEGVEVPACLAKVTRGGKEAEGVVFYTSDADEPFEAVALRWDEAGKGLPDEEEFAELIHHWAPKEAQIEILDPVDWDPNGSYTNIINAVREAGKGNDVRVYRVSRGGVRAEYWVVTTEGKGKDAKLVGAKALAVES